MKKLPMTEDEILNSLDIKTDSNYALEQELKDNPRHAAEYERLLLDAIKSVNRLKLDIEIRVATVIDEYVKEHNEVSPSYRQTLIKTIVPLDIEYVKLRKAYNEAVSNKTYLEGLIRAWRDRGRRLTELCILMNRIALLDSGNYVDKRKIDTKMKAANGRLSYD